MSIEPKKLPLHPNLMAHDDLTADITKEIAYAIRKLGGDPTSVDLIDTWQRPRAGVTACGRA
jgi:hypothetical protein